MKVLIIHYAKFNNWSGAELVVSELQKYLTGVGVENHVIQSNNPIYLLKESLRLSHSYDIINIHNFPATFAAFPKVKPIVWMCNEPPELFSNIWRKPVEAIHRFLVRKLVDKVVVADNFNAERFKSIYGKKPNIVPYGVDYNFWSMESQHLFEVRNPVLLQVGTVTPYKNQLESIKVFEALLPKYPGMELWLAGPAPDPKYLDKVKNAINGRSNIKLLGHKSPYAIRRLYNTCDVLLHPVGPQGGWLVPFEAICAGIPIIVSSEFTGVDLIRENNLGSIANCTFDYCRYANSKNKQVDLERRARWVKENLTWDRFGEGMVKIFKEVSHE